MAGAMKKMAVYLGLVEDQDRYDEDDRYAAYDGYAEDGDGRDSRDSRDARDERDRRPVDEPVEERPAPRAAVRRPEPAYAGAAVRSSGASVAALAERRPAPVAVAPPPEVRITTLHPRTYNEARTIGEHYRDGSPVIMNLTEMDDVDAKRLVDFAAGLVFGTRGTIERVTAKVFLLSPSDVTVTAEDKARIAENGFFNQS